MTSHETDNQAMSSTILKDLRVLVVEDRGLIALKAASVLRKAGCTVIGPAATLGAGLELARHEGEALGAALLDIDLQGELVYPLAEALRTGGVPFLFLTGYGERAVPEVWRGTPRLEKPASSASLLDAVGRLASGRPEEPTVQRKFVGDPPQVVREAWEVIRHQRNLIMEGQIRSQASSAGIRTPET